MTDALADKLRQLPTGPGVYQHKDADGTVLYVGKAKNLRSRVRSYFQEGRPREARIQALVKRIDDVEVIVTDTEAESLLLENNLIKKIKPRYNVLLKDDKTYPFICIKKERFPRVFPTRKVRRDGSEYFGPYTDAKAMNLMLKTIKELFKLRSCSLHLNQAAIEAGKFQPCLDYHIQKCAAPCVGYETEAHYNQTIEQIRRLLNGKTGELDLAPQERDDAAGGREAVRGGRRLPRPHPSAREVRPAPEGGDRPRGRPRPVRARGRPGVGRRRGRAVQGPRGQDHRAPAQGRPRDRGLGGRRPVAALRGGVLRRGHVPAQRGLPRRPSSRSRRPWRTCSASGRARRSRCGRPSAARRWT